MGVPVGPDEDQPKSFLVSLFFSRVRVPVGRRPVRVPAVLGWSPGWPLLGLRTGEGQLNPELVPSSVSFSILLVATASNFVQKAARSCPLLGGSFGQKAGRPARNQYVVLIYGVIVPHTSISRMEFLV